MRAMSLPRHPPNLAPTIETVAPKTATAPPTSSESPQVAPDASNPTGGHPRCSTEMHSESASTAKKQHDIVIQNAPARLACRRSSTNSIMASNVRLQARAARGASACEPLLGGTRSRTRHMLTLVGCSRPSPLSPSAESRRGSALRTTLACRRLSRCPDSVSNLAPAPLPGPGSPTG